jgi:hypothetical protein
MENSNTRSLSFASRLDNSYRLFYGVVVHEDYERMCLYVQDDRVEGLIYQNVQDFPGRATGNEGTDVTMPSLGAKCLCCTIDDRGGACKIAVVSFLNSGSGNGIQGIATRMVQGEKISGLSRRLRGMYRKAYPYETTHWNPLGFTEKTGEGWDQQALDLSRDKLDPFRRTRISLTGRSLSHTDYQLSQEGPVVRPKGPDCFDAVLPDGSKENVLYLQQTFDSKADPRGRYLSGVQDLIPLTEKVSRVTEFALDFPLTPELLEDEESLDKMLGLTLPVDKWWARTSVKAVGPVSCDDQTEMVDQSWDHPDSSDEKAVGPTLAEGVTPRRRGWILEKSEGTLVGFNQFDSSTYGKVLKPVIFPHTTKGRFAVDVESSYLPVKPYQDHVEVKMAASAWNMRFPYEYNTTRMDISKEGMLSFEIGSTIPKENIQWDSSKYEHPHGAGRSIEGHTLGSVKMVFGKNRDEEDSLDLTALGSTVLRLGADDASLPDSRRSVLTQIRGKKDAVSKRDLQWWKDSKLKPGDAGDLENKTGAENVSLRAAMDGGMFLRLGARDPKSQRRHLMNGYKDGQGTKALPTSDASRKDSKTNGRPTYGAGDSNYQFHDMTTVAKPQLNKYPYSWSGDPTEDSVDTMGSSADIHAVRDIFLRAGAHDKSGQSLTMDLAGGILSAIGVDKKGRSLTAALDGGIEATIGSNKQKKAIRLEINGDVDIVIKGHLNFNVTGDISGECTNLIHLSKLKHITRCVKKIDTAVVGIIKEAPDFVMNQGMYKSSE